MTTHVSFPRFPIWNFHFEERDVRAITAVRYFDRHGQPRELPLDGVRLACGHNGVSGIVFKHKHALPETAARPDAVIIEYEV